MKKFLIIAIALLSLISFVMCTPSSWNKNEVLKDNLYRDGITPTAHSDDDFIGEIVKVTTPTGGAAGEIVMLGVRHPMRPSSAVFFVFGDKTMRVGDKVQVKEYWHVQYNLYAQYYTVRFATRLGTNQVAEKR